MPLLTADILKFGEDFAIEKNRYKNFTESKGHFHEHYEILFIQSGKRMLKIGELFETELNQGKVGLFAPGTVHQSTAETDSVQTIIVADISVKMMDEMTATYSNAILDCFEAKVLELTPYDSNQVARIFDELINLNKNEVLYKEAIRIKLASLLLMLNKVYFDKNTGDESVLINTNAERVAYIVNYMKQNYHLPINMPELAKKLYISETYLGKIFKEATGRTPYTYLSEIRVEKAKDFLRKKTMSISAISTSCGYTALSSFSRAFKKIVGCSPKAYQKSLENDKLQ